MSSSTITTTTLIKATFKNTLSAMFDNCTDEQKDMVSQLLIDQDSFFTGECESLSSIIVNKGKPLEKLKVKENIGKPLTGTDGTLYTVVERENKRSKDGKSRFFVSCDNNGVAKKTRKGYGHLKPNKSEPFTEINEDGKDIKRTNVPGGENTLWNASVKVYKLRHGEVHIADVWVQVKEKKAGTTTSNKTIPHENANELDVGTLSKGSCLTKDNKEEYYVVQAFIIDNDNNIYHNKWQKVTDKQWEAEVGTVFKKGEKTWLVSTNDEGDKCWVLQ